MQQLQMLLEWQTAVPVLCEPWLLLGPAGRSSGDGLY